MGQIRIDVPVAEPKARHDLTHINLHLKGEESQTFRAIREGLLGANERLSDGRPVWSFADVVRWLLQAAAK